MEIEELMERIDLPSEGREIVRRTEIDEEEYQSWRELWNRDLRAFLERWKEREDRYTWALAFFCRLSTETYEAYREEGISDEVFDATFYDLTIWCRECHRKYGIYGLEEVWWLTQSVQRKLFRLGRLQFEPIELEEDVQTKEGKLKKGTPVLNVHIPEGEPLTVEKCEDSFRRAEAFFSAPMRSKSAKGAEGQPKQAYVCDSWLLSPKLRELLPKDSNIRKFQDLFEVTKLTYPFPQAEQRIFGEIRKDKENYCAKSSLQRAAKAYVLAGNDIGIGFGVYRFRGAKTRFAIASEKKSRYNKK